MLVALGMSFISYRHFTKHNDFPVFYHPDEWSKVEQIGSQQQVRNLNHPLLMLETANLLREYRGTTLDDERELAITGRCASALLASIGVFCFAMTGYAAYRFVGLFIVGSSAMLCPWLLVYAHYMKEDATLIGGIGVAVLGATLVVFARRGWSQLLACIVLGVGVAAAASGKYVGAAAVVPAVFTLSIAKVYSWWTVPLRFLIVAAVALASFVAINARGFEDPWTLTPEPRSQAAFQGEFEHGTTQHDGLRLATPGLYCLRIAAGDWQPHLWAFFAIGVGAFFWRFSRRRNPLSRFGFVIGSFLATFIIVLAFDAIPFARYALPITVLGYVVASCAISTAVARTPVRVRAALTAFSLMPILFLQGSICARFDHQFADDSRQRLTEWLASNVPRGTQIVADHFAAIRPRGDYWRHPETPRIRAYIRTGSHACNFGTLQQLAASGVKYVVTAEPNYQRFFAPGVVAAEGYETDLTSARRFYLTLFARGKLVWSSKPLPPSGAYVDPELRVYDVSDFAKDAPEPAKQPGWLERFWR